MIDMKSRNVIEAIQHSNMTKERLINMINKNFPDEEVGKQGSIAQVITTRMTDGTIMQSICFGKILDI
jgi:hypothetical protein